MKKYTFKRIAGDKKQIEQIKQMILDCCKDFKCTQDIAEELGIPPNIILSHCKRMANYRFLDVKETISRRGAKKYFFKTLKPVYKEIRINESTETENKSYSWNPIGWMGMQVIEHNVEGKKYKADDKPENREYVKHLSDSDKSRREKMKSSKVYVSGNTLMMI